MIEATTAALHGDRTLARLLANGNAAARTALGLDPAETRPVIALVSNADTENLTPLHVPATPEA